MATQQEGAEQDLKACLLCGKAYSATLDVCPEDGTILTPIATEPKPGDIFADRYEILELIGDGGMGKVYKAKHKLMKRVVAIKMLLPHLVQNAAALKRFQQEAQAASALNHPHILYVHDFGISKQGIPFLVMDYLQGVSLSGLLQELGRLPELRAVPIFIQACSAFAHAHQKGVIHRDIKPANIMLVEYEGQADYLKIVDFGIAKLLQPDESEQLTHTGEVFGSPLYMSPEQCRGKELDPRSDIYSLGCVLYRTVTGRPVFGGRDAMECMYKQVNDSPMPFGESCPELGLTENLEHAIFKAIAKEPADRFQSMSEFKETLEQVAGVKPHPHKLFSVPPQSGQEVAYDAATDRLRRPEFLATQMAASAEKHGEQPATQNSGPQAPAPNSGQQQDAPNSIQQATVQSSGQQSAVQGSGQQPAVQSSGQQPAVQSSGPQPTVQNSGQQPVQSSGPQSPASSSGQQPAVPNSGSKSSVYITGQQPAAQNSGQQSPVQNSGQQPTVSQPHASQKSGQQAAAAPYAPSLEITAQEQPVSQQQSQAPPVVSADSSGPNTAVGPEIPRAYPVEPPGPSGDRPARSKPSQSVLHSSAAAAAAAEQAKTHAKIRAADHKLVYVGAAVALILLTTGILAMFMGNRRDGGNPDLGASKGPGDHNTTGQLVTKSKSQIASGDYKSAEQTLVKAADTAAGAEELLQVLPTQAKVFEKTGKYGQARDAWSKLLAIQVKTHANQADMARTKSEMAVPILEDGKIDDADKLLQEAKSVLTSVPESEKSGLANVYYGLSKVAVQRGDGDNAVNYLKQAIDRRVKTYGPDDPDLIQYYQDLGDVYLLQGKTTIAEKNLLQALSIADKVLGTDSAQAADAYKDLATIYFQKGQLSKAEALFQHSLQIRDKDFGNDSVKSAEVMTALAMLYTKERKYKQAAPLFKQALDIRTKELGADSPQAKRTKELYATLQQRMGKSK